MTLQQKEELLDEKKTLELTIKNEDSNKERLKQFKKVLENKKIIEEFNRTVHPYDLTFYFKTGVKDSQNSNKFISYLTFHITNYIIFLTSMLWSPHALSFAWEHNFLSSSFL